jgi:hypothetical protein
VQLCRRFRDCSGSRPAWLSVAAALRPTTLEVVQWHEFQVRIVRRNVGDVGVCRQTGRPGFPPLGGRDGHRTACWRHGSLPVLLEEFEAIEDRADRHLIAILQVGFLNHLAIHANLVVATEVTHDDAIIGHCQTAMSPRDLGLVDPDVALEVTADQEDRPLESNDRGRPLDQWDESE